MKIIKNKSKLGFFGYYYPIYNITAKENIAWQFFMDILRNYLFYEVTNELHSYDIHIGARTYSDFLDFEIESPFNSQKIADLYLSLKQKLENFKSKFGAKEFEYFKERTMIGFDLEKDSIKDSTDTLAWHAFMFGPDQVLSFTEQQKIIKKLTLDKIYSYFDKLFKEKKGTVIIMGNISKEQEIKLSNIWKDWSVSG